MSLFSSNDEHFCTPFALQNHTNTRRGLIESSRLEPENEYGNVEYKLRLTDPSPDRIEHLVTQLKWRIREGHGEAILFLGVKDDGQFVGLTPDEIRLSMITLERMSSKIGASMTVVKERIVEIDRDRDETDLECITKTKSSKMSRNRLVYDKQSKENMTNRTAGSETSIAASGSDVTKLKKTAKSQRKAPIRKVIQVLVKRKTHDISEELRVAVLGPTESGKSSLLGVLSHGEFDNGRGSARLNLFRHRHEVRSGHTSSISQEIFGFSGHGQPLTYSNCLTTEEIIESSSRIVTLIDLAGHQRYLSTTLFGLGSHSPDLVLIVVSAISIITNVIADHISLALGMEKSIAIVINKVDLTPSDDQDICHDEIVRIFHSIDPKIVPLKVKTLNDAIVAGSRLEAKLLPIFFTSCVTGSGLNTLYAFFNEISSKFNPGDLDQAVNSSSELQVDETFEVPGIGTVVSGLIVEGTVREGDEMLLGPNDLGEFSTVSIISLQRHKIPCNFARAGQKCTMAIRTNGSTKVRKGMVMKEVDTEWRQHFSVCVQFEAKIKVFNNERHKFSRGNQVSVYVGNVKQTCSVMSINPWAHDSLLISLKLTKRPEYIREGSRIIIRHALMKAIGVVCRVEPLFGAQPAAFFAPT